MLCLIILTNSCSRNVFYSNLRNDLYEPFPVFANTPFWLTSGGCKKSPPTTKETPPNGKEFCLIAGKARSKCLNVSLPIINFPSIIKTFKYWYLYFNT